MESSSCTFEKKWVLQNKRNHISTKRKKSLLRRHRKSCSRSHHTCTPHTSPKNPTVQPWCTGAVVISWWVPAIWIPEPWGCSNSHTHLGPFTWLWWRCHTCTVWISGQPPLPSHVNFLFTVPLHLQGPRLSTALYGEQIKYRKTLIFHKLLPCRESACSVPGVVGRHGKGDSVPLCLSRTCKWPRVPQSLHRKVSRGLRWDVFCVQGPAEINSFSTLKDFLPLRTEPFVLKEESHTFIPPNPQKDSTRLFPSKSRDVKFNLKHVFY